MELRSNDFLKYFGEGWLEMEGERDGGREGKAEGKESQ